MLDLQSIYFGQRHSNFICEDFDLVKKIQRLARKHQRQAVNNCNGEGFVDGHHYFVGNIDEWAKREYGQGVKSAYIDDAEETIFYKEMEKIEDKINNLVKDNPNFRVEYQGDPRGNTVKLFYQDEYIEL